VYDLLLTPEIREFIDTRPWPRNIDYKLIVDQGVIYIVFFRDTWIQLTGEEQLQATNVVKDIMFALRPQGVPIAVSKMESKRG
jgi:hypothetical protein